MRELLGIHKLEGYTAEPKLFKIKLDGVVYRGLYCILTPTTSRMGAIHKLAPDGTVSVVYDKPKTVDILGEQYVNGEPNFWRAVDIETGHTVLAFGTEYNALEQPRWKVLVR